MSMTDKRFPKRRIWYGRIRHFYDCFPIGIHLYGSFSFFHRSACLFTRKTMPFQIGPIFHKYLNQRFDFIGMLFLDYAQAMVDDTSR